MAEVKEPKKIRVLMVEDDEDDYTIARDLLAEIDPARYELEWIDSYEKALTLEVCDGFDVCLLDYRLGSGDGLELMRNLLWKGFTCPMIILTGQGDREIDELAMGAGASDYLIKGQLTASALERSIRYSIQQKQFETERIRAAREQAAREEAEQANQAKDDFLAVLSHELRTPLNAMLGWVRLLKSNKDSEEIFEKAVDAIERSAVTQTKFVEDLLDITRIVNGTVRLTMRPFSLDQLAAIAFEAIKPVAEPKGIALEYAADDERLPVHGDSERVQQIINNLLSNAVKFTPEGGSVSLALRRIDEKVEIKVTDTGDGISAEFLPRVFERYKQANNSTTNRKGGLGLGLAIVKHLVELHGGKIAAHSDGEGRGSTFTVTLPLAETATPQVTETHA